MSERYEGPLEPLLKLATALLPEWGILIAGMKNGTDIVHVCANEERFADASDAVGQAIEGALIAAEPEQ